MHSFRRRSHCGGDRERPMTPRWLGAALLCVGALNALIGTIMAIQIPPVRVGLFPYVILALRAQFDLCRVLHRKARERGLAMLRGRWTNLRGRAQNGFPGCRRWNPTMVRMNSTRKASYASAVALLLAVSPLVLALPAAAAPCKSAGLLPLKVCPASPTPGPPSASPAPRVTPPGSTAPPSDPTPPQPPSQSPSQSQVPGQDAAPPTPGPAPSVSQGAPTPPATGAVPVPATAGSSAYQSPGAGQSPESATANPSAAAAGRVGPGPDGQGGLAGGFLLALSGLLIGLSAAIGLRRPAGP